MANARSINKSITVVFAMKGMPKILAAASIP
jgi:hypothetical protein